MTAIMESVIVDQRSAEKLRERRLRRVARRQGLRIHRNPARSQSAPWFGTYMLIHESQIVAMRDNTGNPLRIDDIDRLLNRCQFTPDDGTYHHGHDLCLFREDVS